MSHDHFVRYYDCGKHVESQCRCMTPGKTETTGTTPCPLECSKPPSAPQWAKDRAQEFCNERWPSQRVEADDLASLLVATVNEQRQEWRRVAAEELVESNLTHSKMRQCGCAERILRKLEQGLDFRSS